MIIRDFKDSLASEEGIWKARPFLSPTALQPVFVRQLNGVGLRLAGNKNDSRLASS